MTSPAEEPLPTQQPLTSDQRTSTAHDVTDRPDTAQLPEGVVITQEYATPAVPKAVAEEMADEDAERTDDRDLEAEGPLAVPAGGGGVIGGPVLAQDDTEARDR